MPRPHCEALVGPDRSRSEQTAKTSYPSLNSTSAPSRRWLLFPGSAYSRHTRRPVTFTITLYLPTRHDAFVLDSRHIHHHPHQLAFFSP